MPSLPKRTRPTQVRTRKPTGERDTYNTRWSNISRLYRIANPLCELCLLQGKATDASPGDRKGVTDHIIRVTAGGHPRDAANFATLCKSCHDRKSALEKQGWTCDRIGNYGAFTPANKIRALETLTGV